METRLQLVFSLAGNPALMSEADMFRMAREIGAMEPRDIAREAWTLRQTISNVVRYVVVP